jgi:OmpA-OmpF porin, OOP family
MKKLKTLFFFLLNFTLFSQVESNAFENLGPNVNSIYSELHPVISADGKTLYYVVADHPKNSKPDEAGKSQDIWFSVKNDKNEWGKSIHADFPLNQNKNNAIIWCSPDNNKILIKGYYENNVYKHKGFSFCTKSKDGWSNFVGQNVPQYKEMNQGKKVSSSMSNDGKYIFMSFSEVKDGEIQSIYYSKHIKNNNWTKPKLLSKQFTHEKYSFIYPFLASDGVSLYFSTDKPGGKGSFDIWLSKRLDDSYEKWSEPVNLAAPINTPNWDAAFTLDATGEYAYMSSSYKSLGKSDIVRIKMNEEEKPQPVVIIYGNVYNAKTKEPISAELLYETLPDNTNVGNAISNPNDGLYKIVLPYGKLYGFRAEAKQYISVSENIDLSNVDAYKEIKRDLYLVPIEKGQTIRLNNIFFDFSKATLRPESFPELDRLVTIMSENKSMKIEMAGHTDNVGNDATNKKLSEERAKSVTDYIISKGIKKDRITIMGYGKAKPIDTNDTEEGRQQNRRVEFTIL